MLNTIIKSFILVIITFQCSIKIHAQKTVNEIIFKEPIMLTQTMMEQHAKFVQQLLDINYTIQQKDKHFQLIKNYWIKNDYNGMQNIMGNLQYAAQLNIMPQEELVATIKQIRSALIISLVDDAKVAEDSRWYLQNYLSAHPPLVEGEIPFISETAYALIDCEYFINQQLKGLQVKPVTKEQRKVAYQELGKQWTSFDAERKKAIMNGASKMALIFYRWNKMSAIERINIKVQYVGEQYLSASEKSMLQNALSKNSQPMHGQHWGLLQNELTYMKQSTDIIMGNGIRWDPSRNRYVQDGGIVTEYW